MMSGSARRGLIVSRQRQIRPLTDQCPAIAREPDTVAPGRMESLQLQVGNFVWSAGAVPANLSVESTITTAIRGPAPNGLGDWGTGNWALNLAGPTTLSGPGGLYVAGSAVLNNTGTFTVQGAGVSINYAACCPRFTNAGTLINDSGSSTTTISAELANTGTIALDPPDPTILQGATQQFTATGSYGDGSSFDLSLWVTWGSQDMTIASIDGAGLATGIGPGTTAISAVADTISGATSLTVVSPAAPSTIRHRAGPAIGPRHMTPPAPGHAARPRARAHTRGHASLHP